MLYMKPLAGVTEAGLNFDIAAIMLPEGERLTENIFAPPGQRYPDPKGYEVERAALYSYPVPVLLR